VGGCQQGRRGRQVWVAVVSDDISQRDEGRMRSCCAHGLHHDHMAYTTRLQALVRKPTSTQHADMPLCARIPCTRQDALGGAGQGLLRLQHPPDHSRPAQRTRCRSLSRRGQSWGPRWWPCQSSAARCRTAAHTCSSSRRCTRPGHAPGTPAGGQGQQSQQGQHHKHHIRLPPRVTTCCSTHVCVMPSSCYPCMRRRRA
jgi:hypothetical protein